MARLGIALIMICLGAYYFREGGFVLMMTSGPIIAGPFWVDPSLRRAVTLRDVVAILAGGGVLGFLIFLAVRYPKLNSFWEQRPTIIVFAVLSCLATVVQWRRLRRTHEMRMASPKANGTGGSET